MKRPFISLVLFYILGILVFYFIKIPFNIVIFALLSTILYLFYNIIKSTLNQRVLLCFFFVFGLTISLLNGNGNLEKFVGREIYVEGIVENLDKKTSEIEKYIVKIKKIDGKKVSKEKTMLTLIGQKDLKLGSTIILKAIPKHPMENTNPKLFNYRTYLKSNGIYTTMTINEYDIENIDTSNIDLKYKLKEKATFKIKNLFKSYLNEKNSSLLNSIILGDSDYLNEKDLKLYRDMGLAHILAVSGLHIGIISSFLIFVISRLGIKRRTNTVITLIFIWSYGYIIAYPPSIVRASILFSFLYLSKIIHKPYDSLNILGLAALILLIKNPYSLFSVGFQLSFIASFSIIVFTEGIVDLFYPIQGKLIDTISSLIAVNIGLSPIQAYYFNRISILGFLANIIIVPILSFSLVLGVLMIGLEAVLPSLNFFLGKLLNISLNIQFFILKLLEKIPINIVKVFSPEMITIFIIFIFIFIIFNIIDIKSFGRSVEKVILLYLIFLISVNVINIKENLEIHFIDVGQGDSIYIKKGKKDILIDTGGSIFGNDNIPERTVLPYLEKIGVRKLDAIFISHFHEDHCQGLPLLLDEFRVDHVFASHMPDDPYLDFVNNDNFVFLKKGDSIGIDKNTEFKVLWPMDDMNYEKNINNKSMVGILEYKDIKILFTGDIEKETEDKLIETIDKVDILKIAHHGSDTSSTEEFVKRINPELGIISVGKNNIYNHPSKEILDRFESKTEIYRTDKNGLVKIIVEDTYEVRPYLRNGKKKEVTIEDYIFNNYNYFLYNLLFFLISYVLIRVFSKEEFINDL
ncbi:MAG: DNA internalization-related competence protein ComEC/Rec2 [Tissierella sp.]|uniref:DNA internalization-related competence protein ComEC/Rec2 n=1 Tax=Tissierella sp. TaxID=41274 RepID=UPI003F9CD19F